MNAGIAGAPLLARSPSLLALLGESSPSSSSSSRLRLRGAAAALPPAPLAATPAPGAGALQALQLYLSFRWTHKAWPPHPSLHISRRLLAHARPAALGAVVPHPAVDADRATPAALHLAHAAHTAVGADRAAPAALHLAHAAHTAVGADRAAPAALHLAHDAPQAVGTDRGAPAALHLAPVALPAVGADACPAALHLHTKSISIAPLGPHTPQLTRVPGGMPEAPALPPSSSSRSLPQRCVTSTAPTAGGPRKS